MDKINYTELHKSVLNIYKDFQKICIEYNLNYYAISGTTLGAALWQGIIPWDDDIDIAMPTKDYEKFVKICKKFLPTHLSFSEYIWFGGKLHDKKTTFTNINYIHNPKRYNGVFIDIVPLIALPDDPAKRSLFINDLKNFQKFGILFDRYQDHEYSDSKLNQWRKTILNAYSFGSTNYVMDFSDPRYVLSSKGFIHPTIVKFEDTTIPISSNYKEDLSIQYGHYKKYPDKKIRESIHAQQSILKLHTPYDNLAKEFKQLPKWAQTMFIKKNNNEGSYLKSLYYTQDLLSKTTEELEVNKKKLETVEKELTLVKSELNNIKDYSKKHPFKTFYTNLKKH